MMGGFTTSYRWGGYQRSEVERILKHDGRDVDRANGKEARHSNTMIDPALTAMNVSLLMNENGELVQMQDTREVLEALDRELAARPALRRMKDGTVKQIKRRSDANVVAETILQLDPRFTRDPSISDDEYDDMSDEEYAALPPFFATMSQQKREETIKYLSVMLDVAMTDVGRENVLAIFWHFDEKNPHIQMLSVPVDEHGQISYTGKYGVKGSQKLSQARYEARHDTMREALIAAGYDATMDRLAKREHESVEDFKARRKRERDVRGREREAQQQAEHTVQRENELDARESKLKEREAQVEAARQAVSQETEKARKRGYEQGKAEGAAQGKAEAAEEIEKARLARQEAEQAKSTARAEGYAQGLAEGRQEVDAQVIRLKKEWTTLRGLEGDLDDAIRDVRKQVPTAEQARQMMQETVREGAPHLIYAFLTHRDMRLKEQGKEPGWVRSFERFAEQRLGKNWREKWTQETQTHASAIENAERRRQEIKYEVEQADATRPNEGMSL